MIFLKSGCTYQGKGIWNCTPYLKGVKHKEQIDIANEFLERNSRVNISIPPLRTLNSNRIIPSKILTSTTTLLIILQFSRDLSENFTQQSLPNFLATDHGPNRAPPPPLLPPNLHFPSALRLSRHRRHHQHSRCHSLRRPIRPCGTRGELASEPG